MAEQDISESVGNYNPYRNALDLLRQTGWTKGIAFAPDGRRCLVGAGMFSRSLIMDVINEYFPGRTQYDPARSMDALGVDQEPDTPISYPSGGLPNFNNHPDTTFDDVELVLEKTAIKYEEIV